MIVADCSRETTFTAAPCSRARNHAPARFRLSWTGGLQEEVQEVMITRMQAIVDFQNEWTDIFSLIGTD
jgi:hypothetical protein